MCGETTSEFYKNKVANDGYQTRCKKCHRRARRLAAYNITEEVLDALEQVKNCQICYADLEKEKHCIDHDHQTNEVRGVLCFKCNLALGHLDGYLPNLIKYLNND